MKDKKQTEKVPWFRDERGRELDEEQIRIAAQDDTHILVNAGPGSGKTRVLVAHYLHLLMAHDWGIDAVVAITFTEKAAAEMKERISRVLQRVRQEAPVEKWKERASQLLAFLPEAPIGTIHSFCARLLRRFALEANLDPSFAILDELEAQTLRREVSERWLWEHLNNSSSSPLNGDAQTVVTHWEFRRAANILATLLSHRPLIDYRQSQNEPLFCSCGTLTEEEKALEKCYYAVAEAYEAEKRRRNVLDFDDLLLKVWKLLRENPEVLETIRRTHRRFLVDELQDTDCVQMEILRLLCGWDEPQSTLVLFFGVGDSQQSIYGFRNADVSVYNKLRQQAEAKGWKTEELTINYRSVAPLVHFHNHAFERIFVVSEQKDSPAQMFRAPLQQMRAHREAEKAVAVEFVYFQVQGKAGKWQRLRKEAEWIAQRILQLRAEGNKYGDIALLLRQLPEAMVFEDALRRFNIPYYIVSGYGFFDTMEARDLFTFLQALAEPDNDLALAAWLRSPMVGVSDETLFWLFGNKEENKDLLDRLNADDPSLPVEEREKLRRAKALLDEAQQRMEQGSIRALLEWLLKETNYEVIVAALPHGRQRLANIRKFVRSVHAFSVDLKLNLQGLVSYAKTLMEGEVRIGEPPLAGAAADAVQVMTIHAAKGLEFPVVIVPMLGDVRSPEKSKEDVIAAPEAGIAVRTRDPFGGSERNERFDAVDCIKRDREEAELERLLFVACTRAKDRLILVGSKDTGERSSNKNARWENWAQLLIDTLQLPLSGTDGQEQCYQVNDQVAIKLTVAVLSPEELRRSRFATGQQPGEKPLGLKWLNEPDSIPSLDAPSFDLPTQPLSVVRMGVTELLKEERQRVSVQRPEGVLSPQEIGLMVHGLLRYRLTEPTDEHIRFVAQAIGVDPDAAITDAPFLREFAQRAAQSSAWQNLLEAAQTWHELDFYLHLDGEPPVELVGRWDAVARSDPWLIVDFKTDAFATPEEAERLFQEHYRWQADAYALGVHKVFGAETVKVAFVFVNNEKPYEATKTYGADDWELIATQLRQRAIERWQQFRDEQSANP